MRIPQAALLFPKTELRAEPVGAASSGECCSCPRGLGVGLGDPDPMK